MDGDNQETREDFEANEQTCTKSVSCALCEQPIQVGNQYMQACGVWDGDEQTWAMHLPCHELIQTDTYEDMQDENGEIITFADMGFPVAWALVTSEYMLDRFGPYWPPVVAD